MITSSGKLQVFETFIIDRDTNGKADTELMGINPAPLMSLSDNTFGLVSNESTIVLNGNGQFVTGQVEKPVQKVSFWGKLLGRKPSPPPPEPKLLTVPEFFSSIKNTTEQLEIVVERAVGYERQIKQAKELRQKALQERLEANLFVVRAEAQLFAIGSKKYVSEETIVDFYKKSEKGLRLDWLANFTRPIPDHAYKAKRAAEDHGIFDNYVVLHYDPQAKSYAQTQQQVKAEIEKKKDPILFGVIRNSRRLYFIADWIDETCDLTLDQLAAKVGSESITELK
jgi:hypothetical protein